MPPLIIPHLVKRLCILAGVSLIPLAALTVLLGLAAGPVQAYGDTGIFIVTKTIINSEVSPGEIFTVTLAVSRTQYLTQTVPFTITDPFQNGLWYEILTPTLDSSPGTNLAYDDLLHTVFWTGSVSATAPVLAATFQVKLRETANISQTDVLTNWVYIALPAPFGALPPGSLPGSLPPGSLPISNTPNLVGGTYANYTVTPSGLQMEPAAVVIITPGALATQTLTVANVSAVPETIVFTYTGNVWGTGPQQAVNLPASLALGANMSATVMVTAEVWSSATKYMTTTVDILATAQGSGSTAMSQLTIGTGCRFDLAQNNNLINVFDLVRITGVYNSISGDGIFNAFVDFDHNGVINVFDLVKVTGNYNTSCP